MIPVEPAIVLVCSISSNYVAQTLPCGLQRLLRESFLAKQVVVLAIIVMVLHSRNLTYAELALETCMTYVLYLLWSHTEVPFAIAALPLMLLSHMTKPPVSIALRAVLFVTIFTGFGLYLRRQQREHKAFSWLTFLAGKSCHSVTA